MSPRTLELRIHGVNNTPPPAVLALPEHAVEQFRGDRFGSFWRPKADKLAELPADHAGQVPADVRREAYSWGGMARSTPGVPGSGVPSVLANALGRVGWALLLPFGLANVAYWSRRLPDDSVPTTKKMLWWNAGRGAASTRLFGLGLTVLLVLAVCAAAIDLYAVQCSLPGAACRRLPDFLDVLDDPARHVRVLAASAVPVLLLVGLMALTSLSRSRYEMTTMRRAPVRRPGVMLSRASMWEGSPRIRRLTRLHLAAGCAVVTLVTSVEQLGRHVFFDVVTVLAAVLLALVVGRTVVTAADCPDVPSTEKGGLWSWLLVVCAAVVLVAHGFGLYWIAPEFSGPMWLTTWGPPVVVVALLGSVLAAWSWRRNDAKGPLVLLVLFVAFMVATHWSSWAWTGAAVVGAAFAWRARPRAGDRWQAWRGAGPGVLLGLSLTASVLLATVLVLTFRGWIGTGLRVPPFYPWFSAAFAVALVPLVLLVLVQAVVLVLRLRTPLPLDDAAEVLVVRARHVVAVTHRAENVVGALSALGVLALVLTCYLTFGAPAWSGWWGVRWVVGKGDWVTGLAGVAVVGSFVGAGVLTNRRPLGLLWDLMCFLPRTAHPFAPPCYAERAVPEIADRTREFLDGSPDNRVVLSAHSLGAVLAVAALYALPEGYLGRVRLLTYGVQLRPYFGRIFPELLGPPVLGTPEVRAGAMFARDPWARDPGALPERGLSTLLGANWINLWRRTDYLGFPVHGWAANAVDRRANETDGSPDKIETHSDYHRCAAYRQAFADLVATERDRSPGSGVAGGGNLEHS
ncbi:hypothetical protein [Nocardia sp. NRRL S-836]|uniref:hypothetical protein n=1 Tax=Nocardia sp. NRRL S-836 TaxID=1519492 RepID=UPI0006AD98BB|nr:hypothetical protein [Nocardia sp. NRRL S-836]KOV84937.1 hypothetical protein ADL03_11065 [Nocardia sp. NRRL S-836]